MFEKYTVILIPNDKRSPRRLSMTVPFFKGWFIFLMFALVFCGYAATDYLALRSMRSDYQKLLSENRSIRGEAKLLMSHLGGVKNDLAKVQEYASKVEEIAQVQANTVSKRTGINASGRIGVSSESSSEGDSALNLSFVPTGVDLKSLSFKTIFQQLGEISLLTRSSSTELQQVIASLSQQRSLYSSIPSSIPVDGWVTSAYGIRMSPLTGEKGYHRGIDIAAPVGTPIYAPAGGVVTFSGKKEGFGNVVMISHGQGVVTVYAHNAQNLAKAGQVLSQGDQLGTVGNTGRSTGPHVHYEVWVNGRVVDPKRFIPTAGEFSLNLVGH